MFETVLLLWYVFPSKCLFKLVKAHLQQPLHSTGKINCSRGKDGWCSWLHAQPPHSKYLQTFMFVHHLKQYLSILTGTNTHSCSKMTYLDHNLDSIPLKTLSFCCKSENYMTNIVVYGDRSSKDAILKPRGTSEN